MIKLAEKENREPQIIWSSTRMKLAFKKFIFFAEIFPKKYQNQFLGELLSSTKQKSNISHRKIRSKFSRNSYDMDFNY